MTIESFPHSLRGILVIVRRVLSVPWFDEATTISYYLSIPTDEVDTSAVRSTVLQLGKNLFVSKVDPTLHGRMDLLKIYDDEELRLPRIGVCGIKEPTFQSVYHPPAFRPMVPRAPHSLTDRRRAGLDLGGATTMDERSDPLDVILIPGIGSDRSLTRPGRGKNTALNLTTQFLFTHSGASPESTSTCDGPSPRSMRGTAKKRLLRCENM